MQLEAAKLNLAAAEERLRLAERRVKEVKEDKAVAHARGASLAQEHVQVVPAQSCQSSASPLSSSVALSGTRGGAGGADGALATAMRNGGAKQCCGVVSCASWLVMCRLVEGVDRRRCSLTCP